MKPESKTAAISPASRRNFLLGATLAGAGAVAAVVAGGDATEIATAVTAEKEPAKQKGYHVTPHISQYYETTKL